MGNNFNLASYSNGAVVPSEGAAILAARAKHFAAIQAAKMDHLGKIHLAEPLDVDNLVVSPSNLVFHPNGAVVPSEDATILAARAHNLAAQAAHIDLLAKNGLYVPFGYPATKESLGSQSDLNLLSSPYSAAAANEVAALQAARVNLAAKEAANLKASAAAKAALLSNNDLYT